MSSNVVHDPIKLTKKDNTIKPGECRLSIICPVKPVISLSHSVTMSILNMLSGFPKSQASETG
jgi:hypothetical protein